MKGNPSSSPPGMDVIDIDEGSSSSSSNIAKPERHKHTVHFIKDRTDTTTSSETQDTKFPLNFSTRPLSTAINHAMGSLGLITYKGKWAPLKDRGMVYFIVTEEGSESCFGWAANGTLFGWTSRKHEKVRAKKLMTYAAVSFGDPKTQREFKAHVEPPHSDEDDPVHSNREEWEKISLIFDKYFMKGHTLPSTPSPPSPPGMNVVDHDRPWPPSPAASNLNFWWDRLEPLRSFNENFMKNHAPASPSPAPPAPGMNVTNVDKRPSSSSSSAFSESDFWDKLGPLGFPPT
ncbi:hypothetical protein BDP27DRAFT_1414849 [Rhodocollybia butyracea]|uniref:Uncharacterized protein n=1 Tax=Rhodocollybia butyracea TaxID=206335 RepID=A0A9P5Q108_9AGAR|nr:hypothetical protein BDP27DRAFT_1414849 [Rhodocollybia butyracea]